MAQTPIPQHGRTPIVPPVIGPAGASVLPVTAIEAGTTPPASLRELIDHIGTVHHTYLRATLPRVSHLVQRVAGHHDTSRVEWLTLQGLFGVFRPTLESHLDQQANTLFPLLRGLEARETWHYFDSEFSHPMASLLLSHNYLCGALTEMRACANNFSAPTGADTSIRALTVSLADFEAATNRFLCEEELLFSRMLRTEAWFNNKMHSVAGVTQ